MVIELLGQPQTFALFALRFIENSLLEGSCRPWVILESGSFPKTHFFCPGLPAGFQKLICEKKIIWIYTPAHQAPLLCKKILDSGHMTGVLLKDFDFREEKQNPHIWGRRWKLSSEKNLQPSYLMWLHQNPSLFSSSTIRAQQKQDSQEGKYIEIQKGSNFFKNQERFSFGNFHNAAALLFRELKNFSRENSFQKNDKLKQLFDYDFKKEEKTSPWKPDPQAA